MEPKFAVALAGALACWIASADAIAHEVVLQGNGKLAVVAADGSITWDMPWRPIHDLHVLPSGNFIVQQGPAKVVEFDRQTKQVIWSYDSAVANGNSGKKVEVHSFQPLAGGPLAGGSVLIAETTTKRLIEVNREGEILKSVELQVDNPHPHTDTRWVRKLETGNYLVCHEGDGAVREYAGDTGEVVWQYDIPLFGRSPAPGHGPEAFGNKCFAALRLTNGNTLISTGNGHAVLEVSPQKEIVWRLDQHDLDGIVLAWVTTLEVLENGNYVIGNCHAGPDNPLLIEIEPATKRVVWTLDRFEDFGNSVSNSKILDGSETIIPHDGGPPS